MIALIVPPPRCEREETAEWSRIPA